MRIVTAFQSNVLLSCAFLRRLVEPRCFLTRLSLRPSSVYVVKCVPSPNRSEISRVFRFHLFFQLLHSSPSIRYNATSALDVSSTVSGKKSANQEPPPANDNSLVTRVNRCFAHIRDYVTKNCIRTLNVNIYHSCPHVCTSCVFYTRGPPGSPGHQQWSAKRDAPFVPFTPVLWDGKVRARTLVL